MSKPIGKVVATEKAPSTVDDFYFWTDKKLVIRPFDVITVRHIKQSVTYGVVEEISHITDSGSSLAGFVSSDFGNVELEANTNRIGMNYVKARVVGNSQNVYTPVLDGSVVSLGDADSIREALGLTSNDIKNPVPGGYIDMYEDDDRVTIPVNFNAQFLIGPEGAHLNISGISGLAAKTSYAMFLLKSIQHEYLTNTEHTDSVAFVVLNVKGRDLLALDEANDRLTDSDRAQYQTLGIDPLPFDQVRYFYPYDKTPGNVTYGRDFASQRHAGKAFQYKYTYLEDREKIEMLFANIDDPNGTMESIVHTICSPVSEFAQKTTWRDFKDALGEYKQAGKTEKDKEISVLSWRKFSRHFSRVFDKSTIFNDKLDESKGEVRLQDAIQQIQKNDVFVVDIAKLDEETQGFVFGDVISSLYELKLGQNGDRPEADIPDKIVVFVDELNKYASRDIPRNSPVLRRVLEITERGRSLGIVLFGAEQFRSDIHERVKGNCATHAYGRSNAIEVSKSDYQYIPPVYKSMMTRLKQGEYILQNPVFRSLLNIKFPNPIYRQFKHG
jgi:uncharacterized protein